MNDHRLAGHLMKDEVAEGRPESLGRRSVRRSACPNARGQPSYAIARADAEAINQSYRNGYSEFPTLTPQEREDE